MSDASGFAAGGDAGDGRAAAGSSGFGGALNDLEELRREAETLQRRYAAGQDPSAHYVGEDGTGVVRVTVGGDGRVADVEIDRAWRDAVGEGLGAAVLEAISDAGMRRLASWGEAVADDRRGQGAAPAADARPGRTSTATSQTAPRPAAGTDDAEARQAVEELLSMLEGVESELDELERNLGARMQRQVVGRGPSNMVTVTMTGDGQVANIELNRRFLEQSHDRRITQELLSAFKAAYERVGTLSLDAVLGDGQLAKLYALGSDPAALLRRLGLDSR